MSNSITKELAEKWAAENDSNDYVTAGAASYEHFQDKNTQQVLYKTKAKHTSIQTSENTNLALMVHDESGQYTV